MKRGTVTERSLESKFMAYYLRQKGLTVMQIHKIMRKDRSTIYYRIYLVESWLRVYPDIREKYLEFVRMQERKEAA